MWTVLYRAKVNRQKVPFALILSYISLNFGLIQPSTFDTLIGAVHFHTNDCPFQYVRLIWGPCALIPKNVIFRIFKVLRLYNGRNHNFSGKVISQVQITGANHFRVEYPDSSFPLILIENKLKNKLFSFSQNNLKIHHYESSIFKFYHMVTQKFLLLGRAIFGSSITEKSVLQGFPQERHGE